MKNQRTLLIEQAARDDADEGTEWMGRMDRWLDAAPVILDVLNYTGDFGTISVIPHYMGRK